MILLHILQRETDTVQHLRTGQVPLVALSLSSTCGRRATHGRDMAYNHHQPIYKQSYSYSLFNINQNKIYIYYYVTDGFTAS